MTRTQSEKRCFVIMAIGTQPDGTSESQLRSRYTDTISQAIQRARPDVQVKRADDSAQGGSITDEIIEDLLVSDYVVADITFPNPNVFYELGIRHAARPNGTVLLRHKDAKMPPFDIGVLRHFAYDDSASGLRALEDKIKQAFDAIDRDPNRPDNSLQIVASRIEYQFPSYRTSPYEKQRHNAETLASLFASPFLPLLMQWQAEGTPPSPEQIASLLRSDPKGAKEMMQGLLALGVIDINEMVDSLGRKR